MARIFWTVEEMTVVANEIVRLEPLRNGYSLIQMAREAQGTLPKERRREINTDSALSPGFKNILTLRRAAAEAEAKTSVTKTLEQVVVREPTPKKKTFDELVDGLAESFAEQLAERVRHHLKFRANNILQAFAMQVVEEDRIHKRKVMMVGPMHDQFLMLQKEFGKLLDLRYWDKSKGAAELGRISDSMDVIVVWTNFVSHSVHDHVAREKTVLVSGGMDSLRGKLEEIYINTPAGGQ